MHRFTRTARFSAGKEAGAIALARKLTDYGNKKFKDLNMKLYLVQFGQVNTLQWSFEVPDLNEVQKKFVQMMQDPEYVALLATASGLFMDGTTQDTLSFEL